jgi:Patatin-like phospholipase
MNNIALAFSGGGFRAAAFSMGTLSYLEHLKLNGDPNVAGPSMLQNVHFIGSTSGGSLANIVYSLGIYQGKTFDEGYNLLLSMCNGEDLITRVFEIFKDKNEWAKRPDKGRNLINAFAIAYDEHFGQAQLNTLYQPVQATERKLEVCVNATEFTNGLSFRFQSQRADTGNDSNGKIGNYYIYFTDTTVGGKLRMGDIMASSSCFSGGFEPIIFPDDFTYDGLDKKELTDNLYFKANPFTIDDPKTDLLRDEEFTKQTKRFGLMDGGVADNQAIDSVCKANDRRSSEDKFDLVIFTDVTSYFIDGYTLPMEKKRWYNAFTIQQVINVLKLISVFFVVMVVLAFVKGWSDWIKWLFIPSAIVFAGYLYSAWKLWQAKKGAIETKSTWSLILFKFIDNFLTIRFSRFQQMIMSRLKSVFLLADDIYLKTIRRIYYDKIFADPLYQNILVSNFIYDLSKVKQQAQADPVALKKEAKFDQLSQPTPNGMNPPTKKLIDVAELARLMPTTLWFDQFQQADGTLRAIVTTGQFTVCYNLLQYMIKQGDALPPEFAPVKQQLMNDWDIFNNDPFDLYDHPDTKK